MACLTTCTIADIESTLQGCLVPGVVAGFYAKWEAIDWDAMTDTANYDATTQVIKAWVLNASNTFFKFQPNRDTYNATANYTRESGTVPTEINGLLEGLSAAVRKKLNDLRCCNLVIVLYTENCEWLVFGPELKGGKWVQGVMPLRLNTANMATGTGGGTDKAGYTVQFTGTQSVLPYHMLDTVTLATFEADYL